MQKAQGIEAVGVLAHAREREWDCTGVAGAPPPPPPPPIVGAVERGKPPRGSRPLVSFPASSSTLAYCVSIVPPFSLAAAFLLPPPSTARVTRAVQISIGLPCSHATRAFVSPLDRACVQSPTFGFFFFLSFSRLRGEEERSWRAPVVSQLFLEIERGEGCCRATLRLGRTLCEDHSSVVGRLIFLEIESKWKKGTNKGETILVQVEDPFFFFWKIESCFFFQEKELWKCVYNGGGENRRKVHLSKLSFF